MPIKKSCFIFFLFIYSVAFSQQASINLETDKMSLSEVIEYLEKNNGFLFSYKEDDIKNINISVEAKNEDINVFLKKILSDHFLEHEIISGNYIILKKSTNNNSEKNENELPFFCGNIIDSLTKKPLPYASIYFKQSKKGNYSGEDGRFNFRSESSKNDTLVISYVGYGEKHFPANYFIKNNCPTIPLNYYEFNEDFIVITDYLTDGIDLADNGAATVLRPNRIGALPGQVEPDVFTTIQFLPGINSPNGEASGIYVRGGAADQNLILWEGIPIYHPAHFFGMISAFNPYIIDKVKVYRGGFGAEYGGRVSSVIEMESADYNLNKSNYGAGVNFLNFYTHGNIAFKKNKAAVVYSLRRSMSELWRSPTFNNIALRNQQNLLQVGFDINNIPKKFRINDEFYFLDGHLKTSFNLSVKDQISVAFFYNKNNFNNKVSDDKKMQDQVDKLDLISSGGSFSYNRKWSDILSSKLLASTSLYDFDYIYEITPFPMSNARSRIGQKLNKVAEQQIQFSNRLKLPNRHLIKFGYQFTNYDVDYHIKYEKGERNRPIADEKEHFNSYVNSIYAEFNSSPKNRMGVDIGLRLSRFQLRKENYLSPRFRFWYNLSGNIIFQANAGKYYQYVSQLVELRGDNFGFDTPIWVINGNKETPVLSATQYQVGLIYNKNSWVIDLQAYTKKTMGLTSLAIGFDVDPQRHGAGESDAKGVDVLVKKRWKNFRTWASYSLAETDYHFRTFTDEDFAAPFDIRHAFQWASQLSVGNFEFSLGFHYCSGSPYSFLNDYDRIPGQGMNEPDQAIPKYNAFNDRYLSAQHHLDASVLYRFKTENRPKKINGTVGLSFFNIYQQNNVYAREYFVETPNNDPWRINSNDKAGLGLTPNMVVRVAW